MEDYQDELHGELDQDAGLPLDFVEDDVGHDVVALSSVKCLDVVVDVGC